LPPDEEVPSCMERAVAAPSVPAKQRVLVPFFHRAATALFVSVHKRFPVTVCTRGRFRPIRGLPTGQ
jgi:hypothetical protein